MRPGLRAERCAQSAFERRALQFLWLRGHQWIADLQKVDGVITSFCRSLIRKAALWATLLRACCMRLGAWSVSQARKSCVPGTASPRSLSTVSVILFRLASSQSAPAPMPERVSRTMECSWEPASLVNGSPVLFHITAPNTAYRAAQAFFWDRTWSSASAPSCHCWYALGGVGLKTKPGRYALRVEGKGPGQEAFTMTIAVTVLAGHYPFSTIKVAPAFVEPPKETLARIEEDEAGRKQAFCHHGPSRVVVRAFSAAGRGRDSPACLGRRAYSTARRRASTRGLISAFAPARRSHATNAGTVILARPLYFEGNCVVLDHGQGLVTLYMHLSEFKVKEGETVDRRPDCRAEWRHGPVHGAASALCRALARRIPGSGTLLELRPPEN